MQEKEIKELLDNIKVKPSSRCWEAIEHQLAASMAAGGSAAGAAHSAAHTGWLSSVTAKVVLGVVAAAAISAGVILVSRLSDTPSTTETAPATQQLANNQPTVVPAADTIQNSYPIDNTETGKTISQVTLTDEATPVTTEPAVPSVSPTALDFSTSTPAISSTSPTTTATPQPTVAQKNTTTETKPTATSVTPTTTVILSDDSDPVLEQWEDRDNLITETPVVVEIPNVMTPNGDGYNDFFIIKGIENCDHNKLIIRSRSGATIFQIQNYANNWDAPNVPAGTYYYQFSYTVHGIQEMKTGTLTILR